MHSQGRAEDFRIPGALPFSLAKRAKFFLCPTYIFLENFRVLRAEKVSAQGIVGR